MQGLQIANEILLGFEGCDRGMEQKGLQGKVMAKYKEIIELYEFCKEQGIAVSLERLFGGFIVRFPNGDDFVQHKGSYGADRGCVEPAIDCEMDYSPVSLEDAKELVVQHKERLREADNG